MRLNIKTLQFLLALLLSGFWGVWIGYLFARWGWPLFYASLLVILWVLLYVWADSYAKSKMENYNREQGKYDDVHVPFDEKTGRCKITRNAPPTIILALLFTASFTSCLPKVEAPVIVEQSCALAPLDPKPKLPVIVYEHVGELLCLDPINQARAVDRENLLREEANYCRNAYEKARERCGR